MAANRPGDWHVLDLEKDPTPGDPLRVKALSRELQDFADDVSDALRLVKGMASEDAVLTWAGKSAKVFQEEFEDVPKSLKKLEKSYGMAGDALAAYWPKLERAQALADKALVNGREAQADLKSAASRLSDADSWVGRATKESDDFQKDKEKKDAPKPDEDKVRAATRNAQSAKTAQGTAKSDVSSANSALDAAKKMAADARKMREDAAREAKDKLDEASDAGIKNRKWWEEVGDWVTDNWDTIVTVCKVVVAVLGIVAMIIGGPIALLVLAAALVVLADTLNKYRKGEASLWDVAFAALDCIPGMRGLTTLGGLAKGMKALSKTGLKSLAKSVGGNIRKTALSMSKRVCKSDPIDVVTGEMVMSETDVSLPGALPLILQRHYVTNQAAGRWFGRSWTSTLDQRLLLDQYGVRMVTEDGMVLHYPTPDPDFSVLPAEGPRWPLSWDGAPGGAMVISQPELGQTLHFAPVPANSQAELPLVAVMDRNRNAVSIAYNEQGAPVEITHSGGYRIAVSVDEGRIVSLALTSASDAPVLAGFDYDNSGCLARVYDAAGCAEKLFYDEQYRICAWEDRIGTKFLYEYDTQGRCVRTSGSDGYLSGTFIYDEEARRTIYTDSLGHETAYKFNEHLQAVQKTDALGCVTFREWDRYDRLLVSTDPLGLTTRYTYNSSGDLTEVQLPDGSAVQADYNEFHQPVSIVEADGMRWQRSYDARGNLIRLENPVGAVTLYEHDELGARTLVTDPLGSVRRIENNHAGLPVAIIDPLGEITRYSRNALGQVVSIIDPVEAQTSLEWSVDGRLLSRVFSLGAIEQWRHDAGGNLVAHTDAVGHTTRYEVGPFGLPISMTQPGGCRSEYVYDSELKLVRVANSEGQSWLYDYDAVGNVTRERDFNGRQTNYRFDAAGRAVERTNGAGQILRCDFDDRGNLVTQATGDAEVNFRYDAAGRLLEAAGPDAVVTYERDLLGSVLRETCNGRSLELSYDLLGRRTHRRTPSGAAAAWEYNADNQLTALRTAGHAIHLAYDSAGREVERDLNAAATLSQSWDAAGRITGQFFSTADAASTRKYGSWERAYSYRVDNFLTRIDDSQSGHRQFTLGVDGRVLTAASRQESEEYVYGRNGDLTMSRFHPEPGSGGATPEGYVPKALPLRGRGRAVYEFDGQRRAVRATCRLLSGGSRTWRYAWDVYDRLTDVLTPDGCHWHYLYDPLGRRIAKQLLADDGSIAEETIFVWEGTRLAERIQACDGDESKVTTWHWQPGEHRPLAQTEHSRSEAVGLSSDQEEFDVRFYSIITDLVGAPTELIDEEGRTSWRRRTSVWGIQGAGAASGVMCPLGFPGQYHDEETGLDYNVRRYYDPESACYLSPDPLGLEAGLNNYAYVVNPFTWSDPLGLVCTDLGGWYGKLQPARTGNEINHMPAKAAYAHLSLTPHMGPAIRMVRSDHRLVSSTDSRGYSATPWRNAQRDLVDQGKFDEAMKMDIDDIRARFGDKYDQHIKDMVESMESNAGLKQMLLDNGWSINYDLLK